MIGRVVASAVIALYFAAAWGSGTDRLSAMTPEMERLVPGPLRAQADRSAAVTALTRGDSAAALAFATRAVRKDPVDPLSNSLLGSALQYQGDLDRADAAFRVAATRGWRDRLTQLYWYGEAMRAGDTERAAQRVDALLRADPRFPAARVLLEPLEASSAGREALARRLAGNPGWAATYFAIGADAPAGQVRLKSGIALLAAQQQDGQFDCATPRPIVAALLDRGMRRDAEQLWRSACGAEALAGVPEGGLVDGGFRQFVTGAETSPFGWRRHASGDVVIEPVAGDSGGAGVSLRNSAAVSRLVLSQAIDLAPGTYRVRAVARAGGMVPTGRISVSLDCGATPRRVANANGDAGAGGQLVTIGACDSQVLGVWLRPNSGELMLADILIDRRP